MKLCNLHEDGIDPVERAKMHAKLTMQNLTDNEKQILKHIKDYILDGDSYLKIGLMDSSLTFAGVIFAIKNNRCLRMTDRDLGSTYLSSVIGNAIRDLFHGPVINLARRIFGMAPVNPEQTSTHDNQQEPPQQF